MRYILCLVLLSLLGCHQISDSLTKDISDDQLAADDILIPGESGNFQIYYNGLNSIVLKLTGFNAVGLHALHITRLTGGANLNTSLKIKIYNESACLSEQTSLYRYWYDDGSLRSLVFETGDLTDKYVKLYLADLNGHGELFNIAFVYLCAPLVDPFPYLNTPRDLFLNTPLNGCFNQKDDNLKDDFTLQGLAANNVYKLSIDLNYGNFNFMQSTSFYVDFFSHNTDEWIRIINHFQTRTRIVYYYSLLNNSEPATIRFNGMTGLTYTIFNEAETKTFTPDVYEPDNGPVSLSLETINDTSTGNPHTLLPNDTDWIKFIPSANPADTYRIYVILEDTYYDTDTQNDFKLRFYVQLIKPNGSELESDMSIGFDTLPVSPIESTDSLTWENASSPGEVWFLKIRASSVAGKAGGGPAVRYRIGIRK